MNNPDRLFDIQYVQQGTVPPYAYTRGLARIGHPELIFAGGLELNVDQVAGVLNFVGQQLAARPPDSGATVLEVPDLGIVRIQVADRSWITAMVPESPPPDADYLQVVPTGPSRTVDVPNMSCPREAGEDRPWRWLDRAWDWAIPSTSLLGTDLAVLRGAEALTVYRWDEDYWEVLDRPATEVPESDGRVVPIGLIQDVLEVWQDALALEVGHGLEKAGSTWLAAD